MRITEPAAPPTGLRRRFLRAPIHLYRIGLGRVLGRRFLLLHHVGRRSGRPRQTVLEVVNHEDTSGGFVVAVGFGKQTDWYRNLRAHPAARIESGRERVAVAAEFLDPEEAAEFMARYGRRHPKVAPRLCAAMGFDVDGSEADYRAAGRHLRFVRLHRTYRPVSGPRR
ncbi:nitroreductase family deazaflavin-dependent oxidoreductase [Rhodococcus sp. YH1]|uniref:nitroreductase family deazaflavin-dependent oxidoreductase n=1 Tax=Rhodococcus sp. YH1 TaxID=89066 RepID=UPI001386DFAF|nr:hypothetical protein [Rhodococcus sp. YH1]NCL78618.1 hypothetical protein [Rhodococcus sp. YH1]